jgi:hypothetical protein
LLYRRKQISQQVSCVPDGSAALAPISDRGKKALLRAVLRFEPALGQNVEPHGLRPTIQANLRPNVPCPAGTKTMKVLFLVANGS